jgi:hypothetical protein
VLHRHGGVGLDVEKIESWHRGVVNVREALGAVHRLPAAALQVPVRRSDEMLGYGPPATTGTPSRLQRATTSASDRACTTIVDVRTTSADSRSASRNGTTFMSINLRSQCSGSMAATVTRLSGGRAARRSM